ncbi:hypothetical protein ABZS52_03440 [Micromonospora profundi]|uniref:Uncharacterized protein n=1 Tax=Micromonospora profundi TaxID=1420889 RepID=A0AAJ6HYL3_9ACTN|nr:MULTISPECIES: hypothetical protein [Micromonospora]KOX05506.1 hypothetical protein ADK66_23400 [Micromonospora sp. NRRL B-16802]NJC15043.1 hypothetical protein [Micromonospora profundi]WLS46579.1 hypothetical protein Q3V37_04695 [Micromonospora profundi]
MTVDRDVIAEHEQAPPDEVSRATVVAYGVAATLLLGWFLFGWLVLQQGFVDSVGESAGAGFALLLIVSVIGTVRRSRSHR